MGFKPGFLAVFPGKVGSLDGVDYVICNTLFCIFFSVLQPILDQQKILLRKQ